MGSRTVDTPNLRRNSRRSDPTPHRGRALGLPEVGVKAGNGCFGTSRAVRPAKAERQLRAPKQSSALSNVQYYVPRSRTRASTAFTP